MKCLLIITCLLSSCLFTSAKEKVIHVFVALCDNKTQGIQPVNANIGNGDKPDSNLYWGCSDGIQRYFTNKGLWKKLEVHKPQTENATSPIMRRIIFQHKRTGSILVADAYQGKHMKACITNYLNSSYGSYKAVVESKTLKRKIQIGAQSDLTAFIGHNGLMDVRVEVTPTENKPKLDTVTLCCISDKFFIPHFQKTSTIPILQTKSFMYPGSFLLHDALEGWFKSENLSLIRTRAAKAYAKNQNITLKSALTIFKDLEKN